jgi:predicted nucleic acid-binding Zn ribbon protein
MTKKCVHCGNEMNETEDVCRECGQSTQEILSSESQAHSQKRSKKLAILSIVFGVLGIYPLLGLGGIIGMMIAKKGLKIENNNYQKQLKIGYWISYFALAFWLIALLISLINACSQIFRDVWDMGILQFFFELFRYFFEDFFGSIFAVMKVQ